MVLQVLWKSDSCFEYKAVTVVENRSIPCQCTSCTPQLRAEVISLQASVAQSVSTKKPDWSFNQRVVLYITQTFFPSPKDSSFHYRLSFAVNQSAPVSWVRNTWVWDYSSVLFIVSIQSILQLSPSAQRESYFYIIALRTKSLWKSQFCPPPRTSTRNVWFFTVPLSFWHKRKSQWHFQVLLLCTSGVSNTVEEHNYIYRHFWLELKCCNSYNSLLEIRKIGI